MRKTSGLLLILALSVHAFAQQSNFCFTQEMYNRRVAEHPELLQVRQQLEAFTQQYQADHPQRQTNTILVVPLVFHIIHNYGPENISDAQVYDQVRILNDDYRLM